MNCAKLSMITFAIFLNEYSHLSAEENVHKLVSYKICQSTND